MNLLKYFVAGIWFSLVFVIIMLIGNILVPGQLADTAFTEIGILSVFVVITLDTIFNLQSAEEK